MSKTNSNANSDGNANAKNSQSLTLSGITGMHTLLILLTATIIGICLYLTNHYFQAHFPKGFEGSSVCDLSSFWNCDLATFSPLSSIFNIPISVFGLLFGLFLLVGSIFASPEMEKTNNFLARINALGCLLLLIYSLTFLKGLCPMCTVYYFCSFLVLFLFFKKGIKQAIPSMKILGVYSLITIIVGGIFSHQVSSAKDRQEHIADSLIKQFYSLPNLGDPQKESPFKLSPPTKEKAPIRLAIFSDFQCPACKMLSEQVPKLIRRYEGKIDVQYFYFPLDSHCNPAIQSAMHPLACEAAYLTTCMPDKFSTLHDQIFENQQSLSQEWINQKAKENNVMECLRDEKTKTTVKEIIAAAEPFKIQSTPTMLVNGVKIEGILPITHLYAVFDEILKRNQSK